MREVPCSNPGFGPSILFVLMSVRDEKRIFILVFGKQTQNATLAQSGPRSIGLMAHMAFLQDLLVRVDELMVAK